MPDSKLLPRKVLLSLLARASLSGNLGLFIGTGFSKAATGGRALGFEQLLCSLADRLGIVVDFGNDDRYTRKSCGPPPLTRSFSRVRGERLQKPCGRPGHFHAQGHHGRRCPVASGAPRLPGWRHLDSAPRFRTNWRESSP